MRPILSPDPLSYVVLTAGKVIELTVFPPMVDRLHAVPAPPRMLCEQKSDRPQPQLQIAR